MNKAAKKSYDKLKKLWEENTPVAKEFPPVLPHLRFTC